jgi:hypothetical protein
VLALALSPGCCCRSPASRACDCFLGGRRIRAYRYTVCATRMMTAKRRSWELCYPSVDIHLHFTLQIAMMMLTNRLFTPPNRSRLATRNSQPSPCAKPMFGGLLPTVTCMVACFGLFAGRSLRLLELCSFHSVEFSFGPPALHLPKQALLSASFPSLDLRSS